MSRPVEVFFSYAHEDEGLMHAVRQQLVLFDRQKITRKWHDRLIRPGTEWAGEIDQQLLDSDIILLLISPDYFDSDYCDSEMMVAMRQHERGRARVIPIILRPCSWDTAPFARLQALPADGQAITLWSNRDEACLRAANGVMQVVREIRGEPAISSGQSPTHEDSARVLSLRVHRAHFVGDPVECYFVNLANLSPRRVVEVTHIWYEDELHHIPVRQVSRPLPVRLELDQSWETWIRVDALPASQRADAYESFRARLSTGKVAESSKNTEVPPTGSVPGGPIR